MNYIYIFTLWTHFVSTIGWFAEGVCNFTVGCNTNFGKSGARNTYGLAGYRDTGNAAANEIALNTENHVTNIFEIECEMWKKILYFILKMVQKFEISNTFMQ